MSIFENTYFLIYIFGCICVVLLTLFKVVYFWLLNWIIKANILNRNLKKVLPPDEEQFHIKALKFLGVVFVEALLSWINVVVGCWQIVYTTFNILRDVLTPVPEQIKSLRFPLRNNPNLEREFVWAYVIGLKVVGGDIFPQRQELFDSLENLEYHYPSFSKRLAVNKLKELNVIDEEIIAQLFENIEGMEEFDKAHEGFKNMLDY